MPSFLTTSTPNASPFCRYFVDVRRSTLTFSSGSPFVNPCPRMRLSISQAESSGCILARRIQQLPLSLRRTNTAHRTSGRPCPPWGLAILTAFPRNGRWRSQYIYSPANSNLTGSIRIDVHYYEDGNVRLLTEKPISVSLSSSAGPEEIVRHIALLERKYQEEVNRTFSTLSEGAFKGLRRQLPITRQKIDWEKISSYRVSWSGWTKRMILMTV